MGAQLVGKAYAFAVDHRLTDREMRLLAWMALTAKDTDLQPQYYRRRESTALALGELVPDRPESGDPETATKTAERDAAFQRVKVATAGLVKAGAITRLRSGREGRVAVFAVTLGVTPRPTKLGPSTG
ncbi:hypothetical protein DOU17_06040 [Clavibacter michiganensis subsp. michiganensis]|uniref:hypothetical protein n=1 Tax=Clavibacter michiganensis TaxID=28447 RepID=UPI000B6EC038|nr:hypothetical protein [Clavibacter michiganensis]MWJ18486.1 hypothetical protein [Clavibacter michiganensis subsp. michiganensis]OUD96688.1 hypothetical protein CMMCAS06_00720 [Clavibacter michiganensis subsp. michiganensis]OUE06522.1 hypothetical protein CMMCAS08_07075 [Clavibacter michiganensis subsp. michiganensis]